MPVELGIDYNRKFARLLEITRAMEGQRSGRCLHTSFIIKSGKILAIGLNQYNKTHPRLAEYGYNYRCGVHSELDAALKLGLGDCSNLTLVNIRIDKCQKVNLSRPCKFCAKLIEKLGFKNVFYTDGNGDFVKA